MAALGYGHGMTVRCRSGDEFIRSTDIENCGANISGS